MALGPSSPSASIHQKPPGIPRELTFCPHALERSQFIGKEEAKGQHVPSQPPLVAVGGGWGHNYAGDRTQQYFQRTPRLSKSVGLHASGCGAAPPPQHLLMFLPVCSAPYKYLLCCCSWLWADSQCRVGEGSKPEAHRTDTNTRMDKLATSP